MPPVSIAYTLATGARGPIYATPGAAGLDLCAYLLDGPIRIPPGEWAHIPTGVSVAIPAGYEGQVRPRSGLALNHGLTVLNSPGTIDSDYRGEVGVLVINHGTNDVTIEHHQRIAQLVVCPVPAVELVPADALPPTSRGAGGFGSTGTRPASAPASASAPVTLTRRSPDAARAYHEGHATALRWVAGWLREKADESENIAGTLGGIARLCADGGSDDDDRARIEARIRALEAEVSEARAEAAKWAAELDGERGERAAVVAWMGECAQGHDGLGLRNTGNLLRTLSGAIERGEHRAGGAR